MKRSALKRVAFKRTTFKSFRRRSPKIRLATVNGIRVPYLEPHYLDLVRACPCCICDSQGLIQTTPTEAHHVFHGRFSGRKTPDRMAIPLCREHHRESDDPLKLAIHQAKETWAERYGFDHEFTAATQDKIERMEA